MHKPKSINELLRIGGKRLTDLQTKRIERKSVLAQVQAALPEQLAAAVVSAGIDQGQLTVGVNGATWAARLRYRTDELRTCVSETMQVDIAKVRIKVVPPAG